MSESTKYKYHFRDGKLVKSEENEMKFPEIWENTPHPLENITSAASSSEAAENDTLYNQSWSSNFNGSIPSASVTDVAEETSQRARADSTQSPPTQNNASGSDGLRSPGKPQFSRQDLLTRDNEAVQYTKSLLAEGDTLVYIKYPGKCYDSTGFAISEEPHRVHSSLLLATGSKLFAELLGPTNQYRILRRKKLVNQLPLGIRFVLDLTPPEEGDVAVDLTAELSCSLGIRLWHTAEKRCHISPDLVGGRDAVPEPPASQSLTTMGNSVSNFSNAVVEQVQQVAFNPETDDFHKSDQTHPDDEFDRAIQLSKEESLKPQIIQFDSRYVPEYCPIRHRLGIVNLLQIIERKDLRLDSAPKVWTLFVLAKYFDCAKLVVDYIVTWMIAQSNSQFIEILPEMSCNIGFGLQIPIITRAAFCILVGEESLSLVSRSVGSTQADFYHTSQFGRHREDINEDLRTSIEYASKDFHERISRTWENLIEERLTWFQNLAEYRKLCEFEEGVSKWGRIRHSQSRIWHASTTNLAQALRRFVQNLITSKLVENLSNAEVVAANRHRVAENYKANVPFNSFGLLYRRLTPEERILTRFSWKMIRDIDFSFSNTNRYDTPEKKGRYPSCWDLLHAQNAVNHSIIEAITSMCYCNGIMPPEAYSAKPAETISSAEPVVQAKSVNPDAWMTEDLSSIWPPYSGLKETASANLPTRPRADSPTVPESSERKSQGIMTHEKKPPFKPALIEPKIPADWELPDDSPFFNLTKFFREASFYVRGICDSVLDTSEVGFDMAITDTLVSLGPEFKYLPLWAGGDDDGSGGVYDPSIPAASAGPSGPGPSFHTGFSNASTPSSEFGSSERRSVNTSIGVEDGFSSSHIDRRRVIGDDDFYSETFSEDSDIYDRKGKGVDRNGFAMSHAPSAASSVTMEGEYVSAHAAMSVASSETADNESMSYGGFSDCASESTKGVSNGNADKDDSSMIGEGGGEEIDEDDAWDGGDTESFDFGDSDEDMVIV